MLSFPPVMTLYFAFFFMKREELFFCVEKKCLAASQNEWKRKFANVKKRIFAKHFSHFLCPINV
jgi:hypothetical protein